MINYAHFKVIINQITSITSMIECWKKWTGVCFSAESTIWCMLLSRCNRIRITYTYKYIWTVMVMLNICIKVNRKWVKMNRMIPLKPKQSKNIWQPASWSSSTVKVFFFFFLVFVWWNLSDYFIQTNSNRSSQNFQEKKKHNSWINPFEMWSEQYSVSKNLCNVACHFATVCLKTNVLSDLFNAESK